MTLRWLVASFHILALAIGVAGIVLRARALQRVRDARELGTVFLADAMWGIAAILWLVTGAWRAFGGLEKGTDYYVQAPLFHAKFGLFGLIVLLELWPMVTLIRWRLALRRSEAVDLSRAGTFARISYTQLGLVVVIVFLATAVARGMGA